MLSETCDVLAKKFIEDKKDLIKGYSERLYNYVSSDYGISYFHLGIDFGRIQEISCFGSFHSTISGVKNSIFYLLKLPYRKEDKIDSMSYKYIEYNLVLEDIAKTFAGIFNIAVYNTGYKNIKLIVAEINKDLPFNLIYCASLILFCIIRGIDKYHFSRWTSWYSNHKIPEKLPSNLYEYVYTYSIVTEGNSDHDMNDNLCYAFYRNNNKDYAVQNLFGTDKAREIFVSNFVNVLYKTFSAEGIVNDERFNKTFQLTYERGKYGTPMQTESFNMFSRTLMELTL